MKIPSLVAIIGMILIFFSTMAISKTFAGDTSKKRWGITLTESDEKKTDRKETQKNTQEDADTNDSTKEKAEQPTPGKTDGSDKAADGSANDKRAAGKPSPVKPSAKKDPSNQSGTQIKPDAKKERPKPVKWASKKQKAICETHLGQLKDRFLKARYYSIQGVPCSTAENARAFMALVDSCKHDCPDGFLKKNGYTARIIRNLSWLEKLGAERCPDMNVNLPSKDTGEAKHQ